MSPISSPVRNCYKKILSKHSDNRVVNDCSLMRKQKYFRYFNFILFSFLKGPRDICAASTSSGTFERSLKAGMPC